MSNRGEDHGRVGWGIIRHSDRHVIARLAIWIMVATVAVGNWGSWQDAEGVALVLEAGLAIDKVLRA